MSYGYRTLSQHLNDLKKENFSLKLRIYFLEERIQQKYEDSIEDVYKRNIELKVELESLKRELWDKQQFFDKSWYAAEGLSPHNECELQHHYEEKQQETEQIQDLLQNKIQLLQENLFEKQYCYLNPSEVSHEQCDSELHNEEFQMQTLQDRLQQLGAENKILQENLHEMNSQLLVTIDVSQQHKCTIQNLNETLTSKISEAEEMNEIIQEQNKSVDKLQEMLNQSQLDNFQMPGVLSSTKPQVDFFKLQNTLFCTQLELQRVQRMLRQSERQLTDARHVQQLLESDLKEAQKQKESMWTHNQELHVALLQLQVQLQNVSQQLEKVREQKNAVIQEQELTIKHRNQALLQKEQLLQEHIYLSQYEYATEKESRIHEPILEKLHERIRDRDKALERAIDEKYCALEEREHKLRLAQLAMREKEQDLERLRSVLSGNEETINNLDSMLKSKDLEIGQISTVYKNLQWLKQETEEKYKNTIKEREWFIQQLQDSLHDRHKELEELMERGSDHSKMMVIVKNNDRTNGEANKNLQNMLEKELANAKEEFQLLSRKEGETRAELCSLQFLVDKQNEDLQAQAADVESLTQNIQIKEEFIKDLQVQLVNPEEVPAIESLTREVLKLREKVAVMELHGQEGFGNRSQELVLMLERLVTERARLNDHLQSEWQIYSNLVTLHSPPKSCEESKTLQLELEAVRMLRGRLEEALVQSLQQLNDLEAENRAPIDFGAQHTDEESDDDDNAEFMDSNEEDADMKDEPCHQTDQHTSVDNCHQKPTSEMKVNMVHQKFPFKVGCVKLEEEHLGVKRECWQFRSEAEKKAIKESTAQTEEVATAAVSFFRNELQNLHLEAEELKEPMGDAMSGWWVEEIEKAKEGGGLKEEGLRAEVKRLQAKMTNADMIIHLLKEQLTLNSKEGDLKFNPELIVSMAKEIERLNADKGSAPMKCSALGVQLRDDTAKKPCSRPPSLNLGVWQPTKKEKSSSVGSTSQMEANSQHIFWQSSNSSLREEAEQLRSELAYNRQQNMELQDKLVISEAAVSAQADQLNQYRILLSEPSVQQDSKEVRVYLQDLGYETCGRSENEADREETTSPECDDDQEDIFSETNMVEELNSHLKLWGSAITTIPQSTTMKCKLGTEELLENGKMEDVAHLLQHVNNLKKQLERSERVIWSMKRKEHCFSASSKNGGITGRLHCMTDNSMRERLLHHGITDEDDDWQLDDVKTISHSVVQTNKDLHQLTERVSSLEAQLQTTRQDVMPAHQHKTGTWPRYDSLIQAQARELSLMRLKLREGKAVCRILTQHLSDTVKSFEELLRVNDIDYYMGQSFRDQLFEGSQLVERLSSRLNSKNIGPDNPVEKLCLELEGEAPDGADANKNGCHVIVHIDDYSALKQQVLEGKILIQKMELLMQSSFNMPFLEIHCSKDQSKTDEILKLKSKLAELENILQNTKERLINTRQMKENMERFLFGQLTRSHDVLRKARSNLEKNNFNVSPGKPHSSSLKGKVQ